MNQISATIQDQWNSWNFILLDENWTRMIQKKRSKMNQFKCKSKIFPVFIPFKVLHMHLPGTEKLSTTWKYRLHETKYETPLGIKKYFETLFSTVSERSVI